MRERERERGGGGSNYTQNSPRSSCILFNFFENNNKLLEYNEWGFDDDYDDSLIK
jgi:hypothetical protein